MKKQLIPVFCLLHMVAIFWWTLPHSFGEMVLASNEQNTIEAKLLKWLMLDDNPRVTALLNGYVDVTGSQQYWDFFAPQSPRFHQYLSVCDGIINYPEQERISCKGKPLFSNLDENIKGFRSFGSDRSRLYRLSENLINLEEPLLLQKFTQYYQTQHRKKITENVPAQLVKHQFELYPELRDLPSAGYRMDKLLWDSR
ncbi:hypothetical protein [Methyloglobulus sp.]|uniref:hypothetical protein n=1 Tax=Methyloglobulus sp. TaxID=2518622 RepID=UPI0032B7C539